MDGERLDAIARGRAGAPRRRRAAGSLLTPLASSPGRRGSLARSGSAPTAVGGGPMRRPTLLVPALALALALAAGAAGAARPTCGGRPATKWKPDFVASDGVAWFFADGDGRDVIVGTNGPDQVEGSVGADYVCTRDGEDTVNAYGHDDRV